MMEEVVLEGVVIEEVVFEEELLEKGVSEGIELVGTLFRVVDFNGIVGITSSVSSVEFFNFNLTGGIFFSA